MSDYQEEAPKPSTGRRLWLMVAPDAKVDEDGRDNFNSRAQFVLCAMGGAVGLGNLLRFPSVVFNNYGLQFFIPYFFALFLIGIPILILEIVVGQAYRGGCVVAWNANNHRAKGIGFSAVFNGFSVGGYYVPILAYALNYFRLSFQSPLPWVGRETDEFFLTEVARPSARLGDLGETSWYESMNINGETAGWSFLLWFVTWMCMFKGVGLTGRVIYITMALPLIMIVILAIRSMSLPNASDGFRLYLGVWRSESLAGPGVWQDAFGQMFFSIGVGFGYFTSYASYSSKYSNAVQDAFIIALSNSAIEIISALAVMGVVGFLGLSLESTGRLGTFSSGFFYYPAALQEMPGSNFFSALFFFTLCILGLTCVFALFEVLVTMICDTDWGKRWPRYVIATITAIAAYLITLIYCTEVGFALLDAVDTFVNDLALFFTVWCECFFATTLYRWRDPVDQVGLVSYATYNGGYFLAHFIGFLVGHLVSAEAGAGVGFGVLIIGIAASTFIGKVPTVRPPGFWGNNTLLSRFWYNAFYSVSRPSTYSICNYPLTLSPPGQPAPSRPQQGHHGRQQLAPPLVLARLPQVHHRPSRRPRLHLCLPQVHGPRPRGPPPLRGPRHDLQFHPDAHGHGLHHHPLRLPPLLQLPHPRGPPRRRQVRRHAPDHHWRDPRHRRHGRRSRRCRFREQGQQLRVCERGAQDRR